MCEWYVLRLYLAQLLNILILPFLKTKLRLWSVQHATALVIPFLKTSVNMFLYVRLENSIINLHPSEWWVGASLVASTSGPIPRVPIWFAIHYKVILFHCSQFFSTHALCLEVMSSIFHYFGMIALYTNCQVGCVTDAHRQQEGF